MADEFDVHRRRRALFGGAVDDYDDGRPGYPDAVFDLLADVAGLGEGARVLEVGPGTGQATGALLTRGASVTAVELSADLADRLVAKHPGARLEVVVGAFEDVAWPPRAHDLVVSATAFHWVPTGPGLQRAADVLADGGHLALWWNLYGDLTRPDPFHDALVPVLERLAPELLDVPGAGAPATGSFAYGLDPARVAEIDASGRFGPVRHEVVAWTGRHTTAQLRALFASFSPWLALPEAQRTAVLDEVERIADGEFGGVVERPYQTSVFVASRAG